MRFTLNGEDFHWAKYFYCITLIMASLRALHYFYVFETYGPKIIMVIEMGFELIRFLVILTVPIFCFGVSYQALNDPNTVLTPDIIPKSLTFSFFQMFGELSLDELVGESFDSIIAYLSWRGSNLE